MTNFDLIQLLFHLVKRYLERQGQQAEENDNFTIVEEQLLSADFSQPQDEGFSPKCGFKSRVFSTSMPLFLHRLTQIPPITRYAFCEMNQQKVCRVIGAQKSHMDGQMWFYRSMHFLPGCIQAAG